MHIANPQAATGEDPRRTSSHAQSSHATEGVHAGANQLAWTMGT